VRPELPAPDPRMDLELQQLKARLDHLERKS
jgi:hypothetical protein